jgi:hypothetical protein
VKRDAEHYISPISKISVEDYPYQPHATEKGMPGSS